ncbi:MAG: hypothetical protein Q4E72_01860 [bacterium]|nr:hypothetical protein [bacterium]
MRKLIFVALLVMLLLVQVGIADDAAEIPWIHFEGDMQISNCNEWVSLRQKPDTNAKRLAKVPLDAIVQNCRYSENDFFYCEFGDQSGYILARYLTPYLENGTPLHADIIPSDLDEQEMELVGSEVLRYQPQQLTVLAVRTTESGEMLQIGCFDTNHDMQWGYTSYVNNIAELMYTDALIGGTQQQPYVIIYNSHSRLLAVDIADGHELWHIDTQVQQLGAGILHVLAEDGTLYIAGYYGPGPTAVSVNGEVLWQSAPDDSAIYWPMRMEIQDERLVVTYESSNQAGENVVAYSVKDGAVLEKGSAPTQQ